MSRLFVDTSVLVALAFDEPGHERVAEVLESADDLFATPLLEAEFRSALAREEVVDGVGLLDAFRWVLPDRTLSPELDRVFSAGYARGGRRLSPSRRASPYLLPVEPPTISWTSPE